MPAAKAPKEKLTLRDATDLLLLVNRYIEEHIDEIELNGGALPDDLAAMLDEIDAAMANRVDALAFKIDEFTGYAETAKATKDRAARREKVWNNAVKSMKHYGLLQVQRNGGEPLKGATATLRAQASPVSTSVSFTDEQLLDFAAAGTHPLSPFLTVKREAVLDKKALGVAYEARRATLEEEAELLGESDIPEDRVARLVGLIDGTPIGTLANAHPDDVARALAEIRADYVTRALAAEFPGVRCERGQHLRID